MSQDLLARFRANERTEVVQALGEVDLMPWFRELEGEAGPVVTMEGRERIMLGSNNYLGLTGDPRVKAAARSALDRYGTGLTGSRLLNGTTRLHREIEAEIASWMDVEAALVYTTGYQLNCGVISSIVGKDDTVVCDSSDHASILDGVAMSGALLRPFRHGKLDRLERVLARASQADGGVLVAVDGVFSMGGDVADVPRISELCERHGATLMVDEAHAIGVLGARGAGACELFGVEADVPLRTGTFSKSLASCGGFIAAPQEVIDYLRIESRSFVFSAAAVPAAIGAALASLRILRSDEGPELLARLLEHARYLRDGLKALGFPVLEHEGPITPIIAVRAGEDTKTVSLWKVLYDAGVYVNAATYPAVPRGAGLIRASVMATHEQEHLDRALAAFEEVRDLADEGFFAAPVAGAGPS